MLPLRECLRRHIDAARFEARMRHAARSGGAENRGRGDRAMSLVPEARLLRRRIHPSNNRVAGSRRENDCRNWLTAFKTMAEEDCVAFLTEWRWPNGQRCPYCGCGEYYMVNRAKVHAAVGSRCKACRRDYTWTNGTLLAYGKKPVWVYVAAIESIRSQMVSANFFASVVGMQSSAAVRLFQKIRCMET
jgi:transposase-like protein